MSDSKLMLSRAQLAAFLKDPDAIRAFERVFSAGARVEAELDPLTALVGLGGVKETNFNGNGRWFKFYDGTMFQFKRDLQCNYSSAAACVATWSLPDITAVSFICGGASLGGSAVYNAGEAVTGYVLASAHLNTHGLTPLTSVDVEIGLINKSGAVSAGYAAGEHQYADAWVIQRWK